MIGGGASGLLALVELYSGSDSLSKGDVVLFERLDRVGKKILATGNGQGNLTNSDISSSHYFGDPHFISDFIENEKKINLQNYLYSLGIPLCTGEEGKIYPLSKQANSFLDTVRYFLKDKVDFVFNSFVQNLEKKDGVFEISESGKTYYAENVILAFGGKSSKQFGTDGSSYKLCERFGHKTTLLYPSLVQIKTDREKIKTLKGIREEVKVRVLEDEREIFSTVGDVIFTDYGVSGNSIFKASSYIAGKENVKIVIEFLPNINVKDLTKIIDDRLRNAYFIEKEEVLATVVNKKISQSVMKNVDVPSAEDLAYKLKNFTLDVKGTLGFDYSQVTRGGIKTCDIDSKTYMSKLCHNLYVVGEALDVDGECGGYNLSFAFVSGIISAKNIKKQLRENL